MKYIVTSSEMKEYDNNTITKIGIPAMVLMERAALCLRDAIYEKVINPATALVVAGVGNNGADGLALARMLSERGCKVTVCVCGKEAKATEEWKQQRKILSYYACEIFTEQTAVDALDFYARSQARFDVLADALFGVGLNREICSPYAEAITCMNKINAYKVATDIPSGISADTGKVLGIAFRADLTVTFGFAKRGMLLYPGADYCGQYIVADIGISSKSFLDKQPKLFYYDEEPVSLLPSRCKSGNKGTFGKVLIIAGFDKMVGAAILCAKAAMQSGAGMVKVICPEENRGILQGAVPEVLYGGTETLEENLQWADVVVIGPGLGKSQQAEVVLHQFLREASLPVVIDADAINLIAEKPVLREALKKYSHEKILTPHMGEWARLEQCSVAALKESVFEAACESSMNYGAVMVCKDARTVVADETGRICLNVSGNNGMATAGSGDVLAGIIGALRAQGCDAFESASAGVYLHGTAGDRARDFYSEYGVTAGRIVENICKI